jgi:hypothetical protein
MGASGHSPAAVVMFMPRYFFNVSLEEHLLPDPEGQELPDPDAAWETARRIALDAMSVDAGGPVNWHACHVEVRDAGGEIVLEFPFLEAVEITGDRPN